jgi:hypothetical protein
MTNLVNRCACTWQVTEADHARWLEKAQKTFDANEEMTATNPVVGLLGSGPQRKALVSKIGEIRKRQRDIFMDQFKQFPGDKAGAEAESESYSAIWEDFKAKGQQVISLVLLITPLRHLPSRMDASNKTQHTKDPIYCRDHHECLEQTKKYFLTCRWKSWSEN